MRRVLGDLDLAVMQDDADAERLRALGMDENKIRVSGNLKFDHDLNENETNLTREIGERFAIDSLAELIIAASTHSPEEKWVLEAFKQVSRGSGENRPRLMIAPRHPERFSEVADLIRSSGFAWT